MILFYTCNVYLVVRNVMELLQIRFFQKKLDRFGLLLIEWHWNCRISLRLFLLMSNHIRTMRICALSQCNATIKFLVSLVLNPRSNGHQFRIFPFDYDSRFIFLLKTKHKIEGKRARWQWLLCKRHGLGRSKKTTFPTKKRMNEFFFLGWTWH